MHDSLLPSSPRSSDFMGRQPVWGGYGMQKGLGLGLEREGRIDVAEERREKFRVRKCHGFRVCTIWWNKTLTV